MAEKSRAKSIAVGVGVAVVFVVAIGLFVAHQRKWGPWAPSAPVVPVVPVVRPPRDWTLVGFKTGDKWADTADQQNDDMQGAAKWGVQGDMTAPWGVVYEAAVPNWSEIRFMTRQTLDLSPWKGEGAKGQKWIVIDRKAKETIGTMYVNEYSPLTVKASWNSDVPFLTDWLTRAANPEDPWILAPSDGKTPTAARKVPNSTDGANVPMDCFYGEFIGTTNNELMVQGGGIEIWIR